MSDLSLEAATLVPDNGFTRALTPNWAFWFAMLAGSALGTNLGDFPGDVLGYSSGLSVGVLAVITIGALYGDLRFARGTAAFYWLTIITLRAAATVVGDFITHGLKFGYLQSSIVLGIVTLAAGYFTRSNGRANSSPQIDGRYWGAMMIAGVFGTICGDMISHAIGLAASSAVLTVITLACIFARQQFATASVLAYWVIVLAERCAGTAIGDGLESRHGLHLGLPLAMLCTGALMAIGLLLVQRQRLAANRG